MSSCSKLKKSSIDEGELSEGTYRNKYLGWTMKVPEDWEIISSKRLEEQNERGKQAIEEVAGEIDISGLKQLLNFRKDLFNSFLSNSEPFDESINGNWDANYNVVKSYICQAYDNKGLKYDTSSAKVKIDAVLFSVFHITIFGPEDQVILSQDLYSTLRRGFNLSITLNYNSDENRKALWSALRNSKFEKG
jgi:hypothetical protein